MLILKSLFGNYKIQTLNSIIEKKINDNLNSYNLKKEQFLEFIQKLKDPIDFVNLNHFLSINNNDEFDLPDFFDISILKKAFSNPDVSKDVNYQILTFLTKSKSNCLLFVSNNLHLMFFDDLLNENFDCNTENNMVLVCIRLITFIKEEYQNETNIYEMLKGFKNSSLSISNKLSLLVIFARYCLNEMKDVNIIEIIYNILTNVFLNDIGILSKIAWVLCYTAKNNKLNLLNDNINNNEYSLFEYLIDNIYKRDPKLLIPLIQFCLFIEYSTDNIDLKTQIINFFNFNELILIAIEIEDNTSSTLIFRFIKSILANFELVTINEKHIFNQQTFENLLLTLADSGYQFFQMTISCIVDILYCQNDIETYITFSSIFFNDALLSFFSNFIDDQNICKNILKIIYLLLNKFQISPMHYEKAIHTATGILGIIEASIAKDDVQDDELTLLFNEIKKLFS